MKETSSWQFGLMIAYVLPGFIGLAGLAPLSPTVARWLQPVGQADFGLGPPLYAVLAAITVGMIVSCFRWLLIDQLHSLTGIPAPILNYREIDERMGTFNLLVESHYRYYQFYSNTLIAVLWAYAINRLLKTSSLLSLGTDVGVFILCAVLFAGSRDALAKYRQRAGQLVGQVAERSLTGDAMTNGIDHSGKAPGSTTKTSQGKPSKPHPSQKTEQTQASTPEKSK